MRFLKSLLQQYKINEKEFSIDVIADDDEDSEIEKILKNSCFVPES